jgi:type I restriction enzyme, S subunit
VTFPKLRIKFALSASDGGAWGGDPESDSAVPVLRSTEIKLDGRIRAQGAALRNLSSKERRATSLHKGDILVVKSSGSNAHLGKAGWVDEECVGMSYSNFIQRLRVASDFDPRFVWYFMNCIAMKDQIRILSSTTTGLQNLSGSIIKELEVPHPSLDEQRRIADFLDIETRRVDQILTLKDRQILCIDEMAAARAFDVIRGAEVAGPRKTSGLEWLGLVPADWRIAAVSHLFEVDLGKMLNQERTRGDHLRPYLRVANVQWDEINIDELAFMDFPPDEQRHFRLEKGDLLVCEGGSWPGRAAIWDGAISEMYFQKALHRIRPRESDSLRWLYYCLLAAEKMRVFAVQGNSSTITHLTRDQLRPQRFPFPDTETQRLLVKHLDKAARWDQQARQAMKRQKTLLSERRQALITAAVTGQIDVTTARGVSVGGVYR